ncbi:HNH endonuclease family protein [Microscilla marina]|uniref:TIGR02646 family protein n=1 Tax=Microscilla marina ATCC 23134 TaxID=313606 RepID=A1ZG25_MICM2|nr:hypothetical protein [Microscilla marina]EAY30442.1 conserved hypothetical protein [Microscilla marina ATCC 23134]
MKYINKQASPQKFEDWKKKNNPTAWQPPGFLKKYLLEEQGYICCYCGMRIFDNHYTPIEHLLPKDKDKYPEKMYEYSNLFASCNGDQKNITHVCEADDTWEVIMQKYHTNKEVLYAMNFAEKPHKKINPYTDLLQKGDSVIVQVVSSPKKLHCDAKKSNKEIAIHPKMTNCESYFVYDYGGAIKAKDANNKNVTDTIEILGLDVEKLKKLRREAIEDRLIDIDAEGFSIQELELLIKGFGEKNDKGEFDVFCQVIVAILEDEKKYKKALGK